MLGAVSSTLRRLLIGSATVAVLLGAAAALFYFLQPSSFRIARTRVIAAPPSAVRAQLDDVRSLVELGPWTAPADPSRSFTFSEATRGPGAFVIAHDRAGTSRLTIVSASDSLVDLASEREGAETDDAHLRFELRPVATGTEVTCAFQADMHGLARALWPFVDLDGRVGPPMEASLARLEAAVRTP